MAIPTLDLSKAHNPLTKAEFLTELTDALFNHGFFYLTNSIDNELFTSIKEESLKFFDIPLEEKQKVAMIHSKHFLGYNGLGDEITNGNVDWREQVEFATELPEPVVTSPEQYYKNIEGPNLWPNPTLLPNFQPVVSNYINDLSGLSRFLTTLIEEALGLPANSLLQFFKQKQQAKLKIIKYPDLSKYDEEVDEINKEFSNTNYSTKLDQGVGEHRDNDFLTLIFQASEHESLQVKDFQGNWVSVPPVENTLVLAVGLTLEFLTQKSCISTVHRVLSPELGKGDRYSISFFQTINIESLKVALDISEATKKIIKERDDKRIPNKIGFQFQVEDGKPVGYSVFLNRIKSHPKVGAKFYPEILKYVEEEVAKAKPT